MRLQLVISLLFSLSESPFVEGRRGCGGTYSAARGIIQTPNFPDPFNVPINCEWVIDAQHESSPNTSIVVYLTQLFVFEGLTFTEYQLYGSDYKINPRVIHRVNETNISKVRWVQTYQSYLVIQLKLPSVDSAHLRVLDRFLEVYGFNITYEITRGTARANPCTMMDCGFTGICYDHYTKFNCQCFPGYTGPSCSDGPKSYCYSTGSPSCKNGASCIHVGVSAIKCHCVKGFTGRTCDIPVAESKDCATCRTVCAFDGRLENACKCDNRGNTTDSPPVRPGFTTTLHLSNLPRLDDTALKKYIQRQILKNLQANVSRVEDVAVNTVVHFMSGADVTLHVYGPKKDEKRLRSILNKWTDRGYVGNITIEERDMSLRSLLNLQSVAINQAGIIRENDEFILSCVARGSPAMVFRWFKDGVFINVTLSSHKWIKLIKDPHVAEQYTALLAVERAHDYDEGTFTCQVEDFGIQQCLSKQVKVGKRPLVKIKPMSLTVRKGENFTIKCVTLEEHGGTGSKYTYSWTKNKELLPVRTESEKYEVLYPSGTILQVSNAEKDVQYSCLVQDETTSTEQDVSVYVVDRAGVYTCPAEGFLEMSWPETAPDTNSVLDCPKNYTGVAKRYCALKDGLRPTWGLPNFSECTHHRLREVYVKFQQLKLGYTLTTAEATLQGFLNYLKKKTSPGILPSEGARLLSLTQEVVAYIKANRTPYTLMHNVTNAVFSIIDGILVHLNSLTKSVEVRLLQELITDLLATASKSLSAHNKTDTFHLSLETVDVTILDITRSHDDYFHIPNHTPKTHPEYKNWVNVHFSGTNTGHILIQKPKMVAGVIFKNLSAFLPPRLFLRIKDGSELEYELYSQIISILPLPEFFDMSPIAIDFKHELYNNLNWSNEDSWSVKCAYADASTFTYTWDIYTCYTETLNDMKTRCICPKSGIFALLLTMATQKSKVEDADPAGYILIVGCSICTVLALFTTVCLATSCWVLRRSCLAALKLQCSVSVFAIGLLFTLATVSSPSEEYFMIFITTLEAFFLLGMSSHLSKLLIVFTELMQLPKPMASKYTVVGIISGVTIITVFGSHLAYRTMDIKPKSWWMTKGTLAFNIFVTVASIISILFIFIYVIVMKKLKELLTIHEKHAKPIKKRVALLKRSGYLFTTVTFLSISSIIYINYPKKLWSIYQFSVYNCIVGLALLLCYVVKAETKFQSMFVRKPKVASEDKFFSIDSTSSPLNFLTKEDAEVENECGPHMKLDCQQFNLRGNECHKPATVSKSQSITATFESCLHTSTSFCDSHKDATVTPRREKPQPSLEHYSSSPQSFRKYATVRSTFTQSPDILASKVCVELDLVASSLQSTGNKQQPLAGNEPTRRVMFPPKVIITPDDAITKILESETVVVQPERTQPDGHDESNESSTKEKVLKSLEDSTKSVKDVPSEPSSIVIGDDKLDGMLNSICHDLDYLLNRNDEAETDVSTLRRAPKPPGASVVHTIPEEILKDESTNIPESITLRTNC